MNFVRIANTLPDTPKVALLARAWMCKFDEALGGMVRWLCWLDKHTKDGKTGLRTEELDALIFGKRGRMAGLIKVGWAEVDRFGIVSSTEFEKYNGPTAKAKALAAAKKRNQRSK